MSPQQMRDELRRRFPGQYTDEQLKNMSPEALRNEIRRRAGAKGYTDGELANMSADKLRQALKDAAPGVFTDAQLAKMTPEELRRELRRRAGAPAAPGLTDAAIRAMTPDQLRKELQRRFPGQYTDEQLRKMRCVPPPHHARTNARVPTARPVRASWRV